MRHALASLIRNLASGLRLALFLPVARLGFRIDLAQLLLLVTVSAGIDVGVDWVRYGADGEFSWLGLGNEVFSAGLLLLVSAALALAFRQPPMALALPVLVLASFPLLQLLRVVPALANGATAAWDAVLAVLDILTLAWAVALCIRGVAVALGPLPRGRWWRALAGGLALIAPMWVAPWIAADDKWWAAPAAESEFDPDYPNPASEPVLAAQRHLLDDALADLEDERPEATDLYFVGFAGDAREDVFRRDVLAAQKVMDERWGTDGRSIALVNSPRTLLELPAATVTNLRETLNEIAAAIDTERDVVMIYLASHAGPDHVLDVALPPLELAPLAAPALRSLLDAAGIKWRIVVVSACYSGAFADALQDDYTLVLTATDAGGASAACAHAGETTAFGEALFQHGLARADSLLAAFEAARARLGGAKPQEGRSAGPGPQSFVGAAMAQKLKELDRGSASRRAGRSI